MLSKGCQKNPHHFPDSQMFPYGLPWRKASDNCKNCDKSLKLNFECERVCCDEENTLGPEEHCNKLDDHEFHCSMMNRITGQWTPTTLTQSLDDVIRCECEWTGVLVDPQYDE